MKETPIELAESYACLRESVLGEGVSEPLPGELPGEAVLQACWQAGLLGREWTMQDGRRVRMLDFGVWNRGAGPDFLNATMEVDGRRLQGDVELDRQPEDWERHGHGVNGRFDGVMLHVAFARPGRVWFTRNSRHEEVPLVVVPAEAWHAATGVRLPLPSARADLCRLPLAEMSDADVVSLLQAAAAFRMQAKRRRFRRKAELCGDHQAWYEAWAETLGYRVNREAMSLLAGRAPLASLHGQEEAVLFGTAGFLVPVLPDRCDEETRAYHGRIWQSWWERRDEFELSEERRLPWSYAGIRPANHPHRRLAALCLTVAGWKEFSSLLRARETRRLETYLNGLTHPYWSYRVSLPSPVLKNRLVLVGKDRVRDFLVNHVLAYDEDPVAWEIYLRLPGGSPSARVVRMSDRLFGSRSGGEVLVKRAYQHQALLQIEEDFCQPSLCEECLFPRQLQDWRAERRCF
ncbi:DUF2851 family protein [Akkermansia glycaniphila]|uniref:DUF2851 family protein n=1 Tax=Akkermansia glycaniphila TaxID=1679444 RepID=A0A1C7PBZ3_9BACT|nr:DUF2851 family protein [Akkermansia glycaniphila]OCA02998.1 hypothetical protein AC781_07130 [Akkermansia glycaniphila]SEH95162.1 protein of unknown function (duf2851) [Akkermansia glycaniphila]